MGYILYYDDFEEDPECWNRLKRSTEEILAKYSEMEVLILPNHGVLPEGHPLVSDRPGIGILPAEDGHFDEERLWAGSLCVFYFSKYKRSFFKNRSTRLREMDRFILYRPMESYEKFIDLLIKLDKEQKKGIFHEQNWWAYYNTLIEKEGMGAEAEAEAGAEAGTEFEEEEEKVGLLPNPEHIHFRFRKENDPVQKVQHIMYTYYRYTSDAVTNLIQKKCILENLRNKTIDRVYLFADISQMAEEGETSELQEQPKLEMIPAPPQSFPIQSLVEHANEHHPHDIIYLIRSDMVLPNQESLETLEDGFYENPKRIYALSRIERTLQGQMFKDQTCMSMMYSHEQDLYIYQGPLHTPIYPIPETIDFYGKHEELRFNRILEINGYTLYNDTEKYKVIRIITQEGQRHILRPTLSRLACSPERTFLPENSGIRHLPLDQLIRNCQLDEEGEYQLKKWLYERHILPKVMSKE